MKAANIIVYDEKKFERWLKEQGITYTKTRNSYKLGRKISPSKAPGVQVMNVGKTVEANQLSDLKTKLALIPDFMKMVREIPATRICPEYNEFCLVLQARLTMGSLKYCDTWKYVDLLTELEQELYDVAGYSYLEWLKRGSEITDEDQVRLVAIAASAVVLWQFVRDMKKNPVG